MGHENWLVKHKLHVCENEKNTSTSIIIITKALIKVTLSQL